MSTLIPARIDALRTIMAQHDMDGCLILSADPHQSEYLPDCWQTRAWFSGFTGSAGVLVVTRQHAGLWTDSRYFLQAEMQLKDTGVQLHRLQVPHTPEYIDWLVDNLPEGSSLGVDGAILSLASARLLRKRLSAKGVQLDTRFDLPGVVWGTDRPSRPASPIFAFDTHYTGQSRREKLIEIRRHLQKMGADYYVISSLDDIAWALNIRASDVACNPVCVSFLVVGQQQAWWWVGEERVTPSLAQQLLADQVVVFPYDELANWLESLPEHQRVGIDPTSLNVRLYESIGRDRSIEQACPVVALKAIKNATEVRHIREAMRKDGVALLKLYRWLDAELTHRTVSEAAVADKLNALRYEQGDYHGSSFDAIVGYGPNGAIIHYKPESGQCADIKPEGILLLDSGGQYLQGTTDITRTTALGQPTATQKRHFTLVLKAHIALATARFPEGTSGVQLDAIGRAPLWEAGLNFGHGIGHGVGFFLGVHEGPQRIAANAAASASQVPMQAGMLTSNEPGFYVEGEYGIRIENLILCVADSTNAYGRFLRFETLSLFPIDQRLIDADLLNDKERQWLNDYHQQVLTELSPRLNAEEQAWLSMQCKPLE